MVDTKKRSEEEIKQKIQEVMMKGFLILEAQEGKSPFKKVSLRSIKLVIDAMEYCIGIKSDLVIFKELDEDFQ